MLRPFEVDELRRRLGTGAAVEPFRRLQPKPSLGATVDLACAWVRWRSENHDAAELVDLWARTSEVLAEATDLLAGGSGHKPPVFSAPAWELRRIATREDWLGTDAGLFQARFARSLGTRRFPSRLATALTKCFNEMVDNILQHSSAEEGTPALGIVGYHVEESWLTFVAADLGRGVLDSLRDNPVWQHLRSSDQALLAAMKDGASRRKEATERDGGLQGLHQTLLNQNAQIRFRSGDGLLLMDGRTGQHEFVSGSTAPLVGVQLSVVCSIAGDCDPRPVGGRGSAAGVSEAGALDALPLIP